MINRISIQILRKLTKKEVEGFLIFLSNPENNKSEDIIRLAKYFVRYHPRLSSPKLNKEWVIKILLDLSVGTKIVKRDETKFNHLFSDFSKKLRVYCAFLAMKKEERIVNQQYLVFLQKKGLEKLRFHLLEKQIEAHKPLGVWQRMEHLANLDSFYYNSLFSKYESGKAIKIIEHLIQEPELISVQLRLKYFCEFLLRTSITKEYLYNIDSMLSRTLEQANILDEHLSSAAKCHFLFLKSQKDNQFLISFEDAIINYFDEKPEGEDREILYVLMLNHHIQQIHSSVEREFMTTTFNWYLLGIKYGFILQKKHIQITHFVNLISLAAETKNVEKLHVTLDKILKPKPSLISHITSFIGKPNDLVLEEAVLVCRVCLYFYNKKYNDCRAVYGRKFKNINFALLAYRQLIKANTEIYLADGADKLVLTSSIEAFKQYLRRNSDKISNIHLLLNQNFLKHLDIFLKNDNERDPQEYLAILSQGKYIASKWWILDKTVGLKK